MDSRRMIRCDVEEAVGSLAAGDHVVLPPGCGGATAVERELARQSERLRGLTIYSGLLLGDYPFLLEDGPFHYGTWHLMGPVRAHLEAGRASFYPIRGSQVIPMFARGDLDIDVAVVHVSPPDRHGFCSLGVSASYPRALAALARRTLALVNQRMPRTYDTVMHTSQFDLMVEIDEPLLEHATPEVDEVSRAIGERVAAMIEDDCLLQIGIGAIPEAVLESVAAAGRHGLTLWGMGTDRIIDLVAAGVLGSGTRPAVVSAELMGSERLFRFADENPAIVMRGFDEVLDPVVMAAQGAMVSVNSAVQIDLTGQVNAEYLNGRQLSGIGGGFDFLQGALLSPGGRSIIALPSEAGGGRFSRIVPALPSGTPVSVPRHHVQTVITEHGAAELRGASLRERAQRLIDIAAPQFREELRAAAWDEQPSAV